MPSAALTELYALALRALDAHERRAGELRGRLAPVLAAGGLATTLLAGPALDAARSGGMGSIAATVVAVGGFLAAIWAAVVLLLTRQQAFATDLAAIVRALSRHDGFKDDDTFRKGMIVLLHGMSVAGQDELDRLHRIFTVNVCGMLVMVCGFAVAALVR